jgi:hypothetical protein
MNQNFTQFLRNTCTKAVQLMILIENVLTESSRSKHTASTGMCHHTAVGTFTTWTPPLLCHILYTPPPVWKIRHSRKSASSLMSVNRENWQWFWLSSKNNTYLILQFILVELSYICMCTYLKDAIEQISPLALTRRESSGHFNEFDQHQNIIIMKIGPVTYSTRAGTCKLQLHMCSDTQVSMHNLRECSETPKTPLPPIFNFTPILIFYLQVIYKKIYHGRPLKRLLDAWDRNGSTSGPTPWQIYDDDII